MKTGTMLALGNAKKEKVLSFSYQKHEDVIAIAIILLWFSLYFAADGGVSSFVSSAIHTSLYHL